MLNGDCSHTCPDLHLPLPTGLLQDGEEHDRAFKLRREPRPRLTTCQRAYTVSKLVHATKSRPLIQGTCQAFLGRGSTIISDAAASGTGASTQAFHGQCFCLLARPPLPFFLPPRASPWLVQAATAATSPTALILIRLPMLCSHCCLPCSSWPCVGRCCSQRTMCTTRTRTSSGSFSNRRTPSCRNCRSWRAQHGTRTGPCLTMTYVSHWAVHLPYARCCTFLRWAGTLGEKGGL